MIDFILQALLGLGIATVLWLLMGGKIPPDGSFSARQSPSGIDWKKVSEALDRGEMPNPKDMKIKR